MANITKLSVYDPNKYEGGGGVDFNKIIPMPESLMLEDGSIELLAIDTINRKLNSRMYEFCPKDSQIIVSNKRYQNWATTCGKTETELINLGLQYITNKIRYGAATWYDWCCDNWGTKWNAYSDSKIDDDTISFQTAWCAPFPVMRKLSEMYPTVTIEHWWADEDIGNNAGYMTYLDGKVVGDTPITPFTNDAYEIYIKCWGFSECLYKDSEGIIHRRDCDSCNKCD